MVGEAVVEKVGTMVEGAVVEKVGTMVEGAVVEMNHPSGHAPS